MAFGREEAVTRSPREQVCTPAPRGTELKPVCKPGREASARTSACWHPRLRRPVPTSVASPSLLLKPRGPWPSATEGGGAATGGQTDRRFAGRGSLPPSTPACTSAGKPRSPTEPRGRATRTVPRIQRFYLLYQPRTPRPPYERHSWRGPFPGSPVELLLIVAAAAVHVHESRC